jgi:hypothetical protein
MARVMTRLGLVAIGASLGALLVDALREDKSILADMDVDESQTRNVFSRVKDFQQNAEGLGSAGAAAGELVMNLESGVEGSVTQTTLSNDGLKLHVVHSKANQGEIATPSKVPVLWALEEETTYTLQNDGNNIKLSTKGVSILPFPEGLEIYKSSGVMKECEEKEDIKEKAICEREKLYKYFENNWKTYKKSDYLKDQSHKLGRVLMSMYGSTKTYYAIRASGSDSWPKIIYSLFTIPQVAVDYFLLFPDPKGNKDNVEIAMVRHEINTGEYAGLDFLAKNGAEFDPDAFASQRSRGEVFARSGMNFGAMVAKGRLLDVEGVDVKGGTAKYILKFTKACTPAQKKYTYNDVTDYCRSDNGRVYWH